jgi:uncharacterized protein (DUF885 family)
MKWILHNPVLPNFTTNVTTRSNGRDGDRIMTSFTRRQALGAVAVLAATPARAAKRKLAAPRPVVGPFDAMADPLLSHLKETAVYNGVPGALDGGTLARHLDDYSPAGEAALRASFAAAKDMLSRIRIRGDAQTGTQLSVINAILDNGIRSASISYGRLNPFGFTGHEPYLVSQISGPHINSINVMMEQQSLGTPRAVDAWIEKLDGFSAAFSGVVEKLRADRAAGCRPPRALLTKALPVMDAFLSGKAADQALMKALTARMASAGLSKRTRQLALRRAVTAMNNKARPAIATLRSEIANMLPEGQLESGIWAQPDGEALYAANVRALGDTELSPAAIHQIGLDEVQRISSDMNTLLAAQGMTSGSIGQRMTALAKDPKNLFPDSDAGREDLLGYVRNKVREAEARYTEILPAAIIPQQALVVKRVPVATQESAPGGYYDGPSLDGTRPGTYWINLRDMAAVAKFRLPTLSYHEGVPGHHTQGAIAVALGEAPLIMRIASFNAYQEGWALYAERLMAERGFYKDDPLGDLGRLQDELFRAVRLVVDTGLHHKRWTREAAIQFMRETTGVAESRVTAEIERYMAWPGQALGYKLGQLRLLDLRERFKKKRGGSVDIRDFHATVLNQGTMPLDVVESRLGLS